MLRLINLLAFFVFCSLATAADITAKLQRQAAVGRVIVPGGDHTISKTIRLPFRSGAAITGEGVRASTPRRFTGSGSILRWAGPRGEPMFSVGSCQVTIDGLTLDCSGAASAGLMFEKRGARGIYAPGKVYAPYLRVERATVAALIFGAKPDEHHGDEFQAGRFEVDRCARGMLVRNGQSMKHVFDHAHVIGTPVFAEYQGGGCLVVQSASVITPCRFLVLNNQAKAIGVNNSQYALRNIKVDKQSSPGFVAVDMRSKAFGALVSIEGMRVSGQPNRLLSLTGPCLINVRDTHRFTPSSVYASATTQGHPVVNLDGCYLNVRSVEDVLASTFIGQLSARGCVLQVGKKTQIDLAPDTIITSEAN